MNWKAWIPLAVAIVLGLLAARMAIKIVNSKSTETVSSTNTVPILVAARDIAPGEVLADTDLKVGRVEAATVPTGAFNTPAQLVKKVTKIAILSNQPILPNLLAEDGAGYGAGAVLPKGYRAITMAIDDVSGVAGFIQPTCRVDVVATISINGKSISKTVLEGIQVFAVGGRTGPPAPPQPGQPAEQIRTLTLLATPEQAEKIDLAINNGRVRLVLRNGKDGSTANTDGTTIAMLKGGSRSEDIFASGDEQQTSSTPVTQSSQTKSFDDSDTQSTGPRTTPWTVEVIRAGQTSTQTFAIPVRPATKEQPKQNESWLQSLLGGSTSEPTKEENAATEEEAETTTDSQISNTAVEVNQ